MMMMSSHFGRYAAVFLATALWACSVCAQMPLSLQEAQDQGVEHAYAMQRAELDVEMAQRDIKELLATGLPQVNAAIDFNNFLDIPTQVVPATSFDPTATEDQVLEFSFGTTQSLTVGFSATQLVFSGSYLVAVSYTHLTLPTTD